MQPNRTRLIFIGGDKRTRFARNALDSDGWETVFYTGKTPLFVKRSDVLILPLPYTKNKKTVHTLDLPLEQVYWLAKEARLLCGGMLSGYADYCDEELTVRNADITAEGALLRAASETPRSLNGSRITVLGYGRIGKRLAAKARALGASVTVLARKESDRALIRMNGHTAMGFAAAETVFPDTEILFNTVPADLLTEKAVSSLPETALCYDLAGSIKNERFTPLPGIPGIYAPESAGDALKQAIERLLRKEGIEKP